MMTSTKSIQAVIILSVFRSLKAKIRNYSDYPLDAAAYNYINVSACFSIKEIFLDAFSNVFMVHEKEILKPNPNQFFLFNVLLPTYSRTTIKFESRIILGAV